MRSLSTSCVVLVLVAAVAGCGSTPQDNPGTTTTTATTTTATGTTQPTATTQPTTAPRPTSTSSRPSSPGHEAVLTGTVRAGVEAGCMILDTETAQYLLLGGDRNVLQPGRKVTVRGVPDRDVASFCQEGIPLTVVEARAAG